MCHARVLEGAAQSQFAVHGCSFQASIALNEAFHQQSSPFCPLEWIVLRGAKSMPASLSLAQRACNLLSLASLPTFVVPRGLPLVRQECAFLSLSLEGPPIGLVTCRLSKGS
jgi:hypothetical protein